MSRQIARVHAPSDGAPVVAAGVLLRRWDEDSAEWRWLLLRNRKRGDWGLPKGHQDPGEGLLPCALRECAEETGIALLAIGDAPLELIYDLPSGRRKRVVYYPALTSQQQVTLSPEHSAYAWLSTREVRKRLSHETLRRLFIAHAAEVDTLPSTC